MMMTIYQMYSNTCFILTTNCDHQPSIQPSVNVEIFNSTFCAILDTGAEISLISQKVIDNLVQQGIEVVITSVPNEYNIVELTGATISIRQIVSLSFNIGAIEMWDEHKLAIIPDNIMLCLLLGLHFITKFNLTIDLYHKQCKSCKGAFVI